MKKIRLTFYCSILLMFCQVVAWPVGVLAISAEQKTAIVERCEPIKENLKNVQKADAKARVFLGGYYEKILTKYITPLNVRLVENNLSTADLVENQNDFAATKTIFMNDYVKYQQGLEELLTIDCKNDTEGFYEKLVNVRQRRKTMEQDVLKMRNLLSVQVKLVNQVKVKL